MAWTFQTSGIGPQSRPHRETEGAPAGSALGIAAAVALAACGAPASSASDAYDTDYTAGDESAQAVSDGQGAPAASADDGTGSDLDSGLAVGSEAHATAPSALEVHVNGKLLSEPDLVELATIAGARPDPGHYWYDARSGLWGLIGHGAGGVTKPGLPAAALPEDASSSDSGVYVNDREITQTELRMLIRLLGGDEDTLAPYVGKYWLDAEGKLTRAGGPYLGNLARAAAERREAGAPDIEACAWLKLDDDNGALGRHVTVGCD